MRVSEVVQLPGLCLGERSRSGAFSLSRSLQKSSQTGMPISNSRR